MMPTKEMKKNAGDNGDVLEMVVTQYRALFEYQQERGDDISLQPGDLLIVSKMALLAADYQEGDEKCPKDWLHGTNERTKEKGNFPGTFVEYVGVVRTGLTSGKPWPRPVPPTPVGPQPPGASSLEEVMPTDPCDPSLDEWD
ncbi:hypothetical protein DNTS_035457 [Danionella cerebrum]|uniref:SH3 domain-containing protein n=1 Tax=Danionella cerebrum TaxID=2873325 RepID=A0A553QPQ5_9TELE|nr:hypothetical protein DNTS_035457 [Danionella translucida]